MEREGEMNEPAIVPFVVKPNVGFGEGADRQDRWTRYIQTTDVGAFVSLFSCPDQIST